MNLPMLAIDKDLAVSAREQAEWRKHGISTIRVNTMHEAIRELRKRSFVFVAINADTIDYKPTLRIMRDITPAPILVIGSQITATEQAWALHNGADGCTSFKKPEENVPLALAMVKRFNDRNCQPINPLRILVYDSLIVYPAYRKAFCGNREVDLTGKEFEILQMLMEKQNYVFTHEQIYTQIWKTEYNDSAKEVVWTQIRRLRNKLQLDAGLPNYIKTVREVGYSFDPAHQNTESKTSRRSLSDYSRKFDRISTQSP